MQPVQPLSGVAGAAELRGPADVFDAILGQLQRDALRLLGDEPVSFVREQIRERPTSQVLRVRCRTHRRTRHYYVRMFRLRHDGPSRQALETRIIREFETTDRVWRQLAGTDGFSSARPVACFPEHLAIVSEEAEGRTLSDVLQRSAAWHPGEPALRELEAILRRVGGWLRVFQETAVCGTYSLNALRDYIDIRLRKLVAAPRARFGERNRSAVLQYFDRTAARAASSDLRDTLVHGDFAPANILIDGSKVVVLDFAMAGRGSRYHDVTRAYSQLGLLAMKPQFSRSTVARLQRALLDGFDPAVRDADPLFGLLVLMHRTNHLATLALRDETRAARVYNWLVRRHHRRWLDELVRAS